MFGPRPLRVDGCESPRSPPADLQTPLRLSPFLPPDHTHGSGWEAGSPSVPPPLSFKSRRSVSCNVLDEKIARDGGHRGLLHFRPWPCTWGGVEGRPLQDYESTKHVVGWRTSVRVGEGGGVP